MKGILKKGLAVVASLALSVCIFAASGCHLFRDTQYEPENNYEVDIGGNQGGQSENPGGNEGEIEQGQDDKEPEQDEEKEPEIPETPDKDPEEENPGGEIGSDESEEPEKPEDNKPTRDELLAELDKIYGKVLNYNGDDFIRDENDEPITAFKHDELYETIMDIFQNKPMIEGSSFSYYDNFYGDYSSIEDIFRNYNREEKVYTIASLCEYSNPRTENDKTLKIVEIPMDLSSNSFSDLQNQLDNLVLYQVKAENYDYKVSNIEYADDYLPEGMGYSDKEFIDGITTAFYKDSTKPQNVLVLLEDLETSSGGYNLGIHDIVDTIVVEINDDNVSIKTKTIRISERGNNFCYNLINNYNDESYVFVSDVLTEKNINLYQTSVNTSLIDDITSAQPKEMNELDFNK